MINTADKRMFTKKITESDAFLDMPLSAQCLYFHLNMNADDDGFVNAPKKIQRLIGAKDDDLKLLIMKSFLLVFEHSVVVIKHWRMHNTIRQDRYHPTDYQDEFKSLGLKDNGSYSLNGNGNHLATTWQPNGNSDIDLDIDLDLDNKEEIYKEEKKIKKPTLEEIQEYCQSRNNDVNVKKFYDYYEANEWKDKDGKKIKNWKQKVITWEGRKRKDNLPKWFNNEPKRKEVDYERKKLAEAINNGTYKP